MGKYCVRRCAAQGKERRRVDVGAHLREVEQSEASKGVSQSPQSLSVAIALA